MNSHLDWHQTFYHISARSLETLTCLENAKTQKQFRPHTLNTTDALPTKLGSAHNIVENYSVFDTVKKIVPDIQETALCGIRQIQNSTRCFRWFWNSCYGTRTITSFVP